MPSRGRSATWPSDETEEALLEELQGRGAFDIVALQIIRTINCPVGDKELWDMLRLERDGIWRPRMLVHGAVVASDWTLDNGAFLESVDTEEYRGKIANSPGIDVYQ